MLTTLSPSLGTQVLLLGVLSSIVEELRHRKQLENKPTWGNMLYNVQDQTLAGNAGVIDRGNSGEQVPFGKVEAKTWGRESHICNRNKLSRFGKVLSENHEIGAP